MCFHKDFKFEAKWHFLPRAQGTNENNNTSKGLFFSHFTRISEPRILKHNAKIN